MKINDILNNFDATNSDDIIKAMTEIKTKLKVDITRDYLQGKINNVNNASTEDEKKKLCKSLIPYLEWYIQGN